MPQVQTTYNEIHQAGYWLDFCKKYNVNEYCMAEGADPETVCYITMKDALEWNLLEDIASDDTPDDEIEFTPCSECDGHDACQDFGCAIELGLGHLINRDLE